MRKPRCRLPEDDRAQLAESYLAALRRQAEHVREALGEATFARFAIGGGTPTFMDVEGLDLLFTLALLANHRSGAGDTTW